MTIHNFSAGPGVLPPAVLAEAQRDMLNYAGTGCSLMELSHRSKEFEACINTAKENLTKLLDIPSNYRILFMQGGASSQFAMVVYNLIGADPNHPADYLVTGAWSKRAVEEARLLGAKVNIVVDTSKTNHDGDIVPADQWKFSEPGAPYIYYCENETVHGVEFSPFPFDAVPANVPIVCDMSSNILSRPVDVSRYGVIFAGAQKNMGPAGVTVVIIRQDLIGTRYSPSLKCPIMFDFKVCNDNNSLYNTPPTWAIYVTGLVFKWLLETVGGLRAMEEINVRKSTAVYEALDNSGGFYVGTVKKGFRSRMNVPFRIVVDGKPSKDVEAEFIKQAEKLGMVQLAGHRSVGGIRASLYNALSEDSVEALIAFMKNFQKQHQ